MERPSERRWQSWSAGPTKVRRADVMVVAVVQVAGTYAASRHQPDRRAFDLLAGVLLAAGALTLVARRHRPVAVLGAAFATTFGYELLDYPFGPIWLALVVALFTVQTTGHRLIGFAAIALGYASLWWEPLLLGHSGPSLGQALALAAWLAVLVAVGEVVRVRRAYVAEARQRTRAAEHARAEEARRRQGEERLRIARDLHDVLAHNISLINVQASTALHLLDERPQQARPALTAIKHASSEALGELRSVLDALRQEGEAAARKPAPNLSRVSELTAQAAAAGLEVQTIVGGDARALPAGVELAAFGGPRIFCPRPAVGEQPPRTGMKAGLFVPTSWGTPRPGMGGVPPRIRPVM